MKFIFKIIFFFLKTHKTAIELFVQMTSAPFVRARWRVRPWVQDPQDLCELLMKKILKTDSCLVLISGVVLD